MLVLDQRIMALKGTLSGQSSLSSTTSSPTSKICPAHDTSLRNLSDCVGLLDTVKAISSSQKMPVVLVYRERHHRTRHRHQEKGKSNKIVFAKEKRDFLQFLGLPGRMVTESGIDFDVRPSSALSEGPPALLQKLKDADDAQSQDNFESLEVRSTHDNSDKTNGDLGDTPFEEAGHSPSRESSIRSISSSPHLKPSSVSREEKRVSLVDQFLGMRKRLSVSPSRVDGDSNANHYRSCDVLNSGGDDSSTKGPADTRSTLSCDSCSSNESSISESQDIEDSSDTAVLANYLHRDYLLSPPVRASDETYLVLAFEKIGLKKTVSLISPFLRMSIRDTEGNLLAEEQETSTWEMINENYLRAPSSVFIQETLDDLPDDAAIFLEMRSILPEKRKISTICYTFLEKSEIKAGDFICELYKPPIQFTRKDLIPYSEKAFFLHFELKVEESPSEYCSSSTLQN